MTTEIRSIHSIEEILLKLDELVNDAHGEDFLNDTVIELLKSLPDDEFSKVCAIFGELEQPGYEDAKSLKRMASGETSQSGGLWVSHKANSPSKACLDTYLKFAKQTLKVAKEASDAKCVLVTDRNSDKSYGFSYLIRQEENSSYVIFTLNQGYGTPSTVYVSKQSLENSNTRGMEYTHSLAGSFVLPAAAERRAKYHTPRRK